MKTIMYRTGPALVLAFCIGYEIGYRRALYWTVGVFKGVFRGKKNARS